MRVHILSALHLEHGFFEMPAVDSDVLVLAGDPARGMAECAAALMDHRAILWREAGRDRRLTPQDLLGEHQADRRWLEKQLAAPFDGPTVVITHHAPHPLSIAPRYAADWMTCGFASALPESFFEVPVLWIHGHTHTRFDYRVNGCRVVCNPRGYELWGGDFEVDDFDAALVIEVKP